MTTLHKAAQAIRALREWIQAVPQDTPLPAMPGIDGDWLDDVEAALAQEPEQPAGQEPAKRLTDEHVTPADRWIEGELDRIAPHRHEQGHDGAETEALRKLVFEFHLACDLLISHCNKHPTMGDSMFSVVLMRQLLGRGRDDAKGQP